MCCCSFDWHGFNFLTNIFHIYSSTKCLIARRFKLNGFHLCKMEEYFRSKKRTWIYVT